MLHAVGASARSAGKAYREAVRWKQATPMTERVGSLVVRECKAGEFADCDVVFSGLDSDVAGEIGMSLVFLVLPSSLPIASSPHPRPRPPC